MKTNVLTFSLKGTKPYYAVDKVKVDDTKGISNEDGTQTDNRNRNLEGRTILFRDVDIKCFRITRFEQNTHKQFFNNVVKNLLY